jgi:mannose/fructose/N-acetylgalactosamine-specific phosphotransferase system component IID
MKKITGLLTFLLPSVTFAQENEGIGGSISKIQDIVESLIPLIIGIAVVVFIWGILKYVIAKDEDSQKEARSIMIYGIIVLFVMVSVWGLVKLLSDTLDIKTGGSTGIKLPTIPN